MGKRHQINVTDSIFADQIMEKNEVPSSFTYNCVIAGFAGPVPLQVNLQNIKRTYFKDGYVARDLILKDNEFQRRLFDYLIHQDACILSGGIVYGTNSETSSQQIVFGFSPLAYPRLISGIVYLKTIVHKEVQHKLSDIIKGEMLKSFTKNSIENGSVEGKNACAVVYRYGITLQIRIPDLTLQKLSESQNVLLQSFNVRGVLFYVSIVSTWKNYFTLSITCPIRSEAVLLVTENRKVEEIFQLWFNIEITTADPIEWWRNKV